MSETQKKQQKIPYEGWKKTPASTKELKLVKEVVETLDLDPLYLGDNRYYLLDKADELLHKLGAHDDRWAELAVERGRHTLPKFTSCAN